MNDIRPWGMDVKTFLTVLHLSQFAGFVLPGAGLILPIIMWAVNKDLHEDIDKHGKVIVNWILSALIYSVICGILTVVVVGVVGLIAIALCGLIFPIVGAVNANNGKLWPYPLSIKLIK